MTSSQRIVWTSVTLLALAVSGACAQAPKPTLTEMVPMADGTRLATDVYLPGQGTGPWPTVVIRTPYNRSQYNREYGTWAQKGYAIVLQDMRGRFASEGLDLAFFGCGWGEHRDGADTLAWITKQPWSDGRIGTAGASAMGITQNLLAVAAPDGLAAQYILVAAGSLYHHAAYTGGALRLALVSGWLFDNRFDPANVWLTVLHPMYDAHWKRFDAIAQADKTRAPAVHYGGWYDVFLQGTLDAFVARQEHGGPGSRGTQKLIIGPWSHGGPGDPSRPRPVGELTYPDNSRHVPAEVNAQAWFAHYLRGDDNGIDRTPPVHYYTMGAIGEPNAPGNVWRHEDAWPPPSEPTAYFLHVDGTLSRDKSDASNDTRVFVADPRDPVPTRGGCNLCIPPGPFDQREIEQRPDVLVFTSVPLDEPIEVTGRVTARLFVSSDRPDTDVAVKLCDVYPDGRSFNVCDGLLRLRHRNGFDRVDLLEPDEIGGVEVDLWSTSLVFNRGHRIRVEVAGSNYPRFDVNPNTGWPAWPFCPVQTARNTIHCSGPHASQIVLPVVRRP